MSRVVEPLAAIRNSFVLSALPTEVQAELAALAREEIYQPGSLLARAGELPDRLWYVSHGAVEIGLYSREGRSVLLSPIVAGGWATWLACFSPAPLPHDLWTGPETRLLAFPSDVLRRMAAAHPAIYPRLIERIGDRVRELIGWSFSSTLVDPERRLAYLLVHNCREMRRPSDGPYILNLSHERIGQMGIGTRQRVARLLTALESRGLVSTRYGQVEVPSLSQLDAFAAVTR
jgi:CRP-like cAMP-binding protein